MPASLASIPVRPYLLFQLPAVIIINLIPADKLSGKVIWITGASSGIGESLAYRAALSGAKLVLSGTNDQALHAVRNKCLSLMSEGKPSRVLILVFNMKDLSCHASQVAQVIQHFGRIDILVNNAGRSQRAMFHEVDIGVDQEMFQINVIGLINLSRLVLQHWYKSRSKGMHANQHGNS